MKPSAPAPAIRPRHDSTLAEIDALEDRLYEHNRAATGRDDGAGLGFVVHDDAGALIGAVAGHSWAGMAEIVQLWVDKVHRGNGLGRALIEAVKTEAAARDCQSIFVMSYDFQAPGLYERCGFRRVAEVEGWPPGHAHVVLRLDLAGGRQP
jgi:N-acetylglutamate synthase-like GNAT family acetyltransferase